MTDLLAAARRGLVRADDLLLAARDRLTPGQRWTATILGLVAMAVLLVGAPTRTVVLPGDRVAGAAEPQLLPDAAPRRPAFEATVAAPMAAARPSPAGSGRAAPPVAAVPDPPAASLGPPAATTPPRVTALLPAAGSGPPGRTEADVADVFLRAAEFVVAASAAVDGTDACVVVGGAGTLVLGPEVVPPELLDCLVASGATLLAFDAGGTREGVVSSRRSQVDALGALAGWAAASEDVPVGAVGIVGGTDDRPWIEAAVPAMSAAGVEVVATAFVSDAATASAEVRSFVAEGVETVVLAAPADLRRHWAAQHALLDATVQFVVADAHDGVGDERYAPTFDGALAHTTLRVPWQPREHGETPEQTTCRERWEEAALPPRLLGADETRWVHAWCQHVAIAGAAVSGAAVSGGTITDTLRRLTIPSPLTADLGPAGDGGWGPTEDAVVVWRASCGCWQEQTPFDGGAPRDEGPPGAAVATRRSGQP